MFASRLNTGQYFAAALNDECYKDIPEYISKVYGHNMHTECILYEDNMNINKNGEPLSKCGQCLELVGPSLKPVTCVVTQSFRYVINLNETVMDYVKRTIAVTEDTLNRLTSTTLGTNEMYSQVTVRQIDCKFKIKPSLYVVDSNESVSTLQIINSNKLLEKIVYNDVDYYIQNDAKFYVHNDVNATKIIAYALDGNVTSFHNVNITYNSTSYESYTLMPIDTYESCSYIVNPVLISPTKRETLIAFAYRVYTYNSSNILLSNPIVNNSLLFNSDNDGKVNICFKTPNVLIINQHFKLFTFTVKSKVSFQLNQSFVGLEPSGSEVLNKSNILQFITKYEMYNYKDGEYYMQSYRFDIPMNFTMFINIVAIEFDMKKPGEFEVYEAFFSERHPSDYELCDYSSMSCSNTECTYEGEEETNLPWTSNCAPQCGRCRTGYICSKYGKCAIEPNFNIRDSGYLNKLLLSVFILLFIIA